MPILSIDPYHTRYAERSDLDFSWEEEGYNIAGLRSHALRPGYGAGWDPTRVEQFMMGGVEYSHACVVQLRAIPLMPMEGPHENQCPMLYKVPLGNVECQEAYVELQGGELGFPLRMFGVASDNLLTQFDGSMYPNMWNCEWFPRVHRPLRRYTPDSLEIYQEHTDNSVEWIQDNAYSTQTPNLAPILNEIFGRPGWKYNNVLCLLLCPNYKFTITPFQPDWQGYMGYVPTGWEGAASSTKPRLTIIY